jgi:uncharacterized protein YndB with AHSA1/START domain
MLMPLHFDISRHINAVTRELDRCERDGAPAWRLRASRTFTTGIEDVWDAVTNPERIPRWFMPISGDLKPGGNYQLEGNAGGRILECEAPRRLGITWEYGGDVSWVTVRLEAESEVSTRLQLEHVAHVPPEFWDQYGPGAVGVGWEQGLLGLANHLEGGEAVDPASAAEWQVSDEGKSFASASSEGWCRASIAAGTDETAAWEAAARTTAFYTGEAQP